MSDAYARVKPGKLLLKGGLALIDKKDSASKRRRKGAVKTLQGDAQGAAEGAALAVADEAPRFGIGGDVGAAPSKSYEDLFPSEVKRMAEAKGRTNAWGTNFRAAPEILHGYSTKLTGKLSTEQRLDVRAASKADKFCK